MKQSDPVMQEVWQAKEANVKKIQNLATYMAYLRKQAKRKQSLLASASMCDDLGAKNSNDRTNARTRCEADSGA